MDQFLKVRSWLWAIATVAATLVAFVLTALAVEDICRNECGVGAEVATWAPIMVMPAILATYMTRTFEPWRTARDMDRWMSGLALLSSLGSIISFVVAIGLVGASTYLGNMHIRTFMLIFIMFVIGFASIFLICSTLVFLVRYARGTWSAR